MGDWVQVADVDDIGPGGKYVWVGEEEVLLVRHGGEVFALGYLCSHQDMELEGGHEENGAWVCPHHGARFSLKTGEVLAMPAVEGVPVFETRVEGSKVFVKEPAP
jgi:nitrite reductase/ring-hydroxylating ferredoxin subunit